MSGLGLYEPIQAIVSALFILTHPAQVIVVVDKKPMISVSTLSSRNPTNIGLIGGVVMRFGLLKLL